MKKAYILQHFLFFLLYSPNTLNASDCGQTDFRSVIRSADSKRIHSYRMAESDQVDNTGVLLSRLWAIGKGDETLAADSIELMASYPGIAFSEALAIAAFVKLDIQLEPNEAYSRLDEASFKSKGNVMAAFLTGILKLPTWQGKVYRGDFEFKKDADSLLEILIKDKQIVFEHALSASKDQDIASHFIGINRNFKLEQRLIAKTDSANIQEEGKEIAFTITSHTGRDLSRVDDLELGLNDEQEVLFPPFSRFRYIRHRHTKSDNGNPRIEIELEEITVKESLPPRIFDHTNLITIQELNRDMGYYPYHPHKFMRRLAGERLVTKDFDGTLYWHEQGEVKKLGEGNGFIVVRSVWDNKTAYKVPKNEDKIPALPQEYLIYLELKQNHDKWQIPVVDTMSISEQLDHIEMPLLKRKYFGDRIESLTESQTKDLEKLFTKVKTFVTETGIPMDFKASNLWWDEGKGFWRFIDLGPRFTTPYGFTLDVPDFATFLKIWKDFDPPEVKGAITLQQMTDRLMLR